MILVISNQNSLKCQRKIIIPLIFIIGYLCNSLSQTKYEYSADAEKSFSSAIQLYRSGDYEAALDLFQKLKEQQPLHQRTTASYIMAAKTLQDLRRYSESERLLTTLLNTIPESNYKDDVHYTLAIDYMMLQLYEEAARQLIKSIEKTSDHQLYEHASVLFETIAEKRLSEQNLQILYRDAMNIETQDLISLNLAKKYGASGTPDRATSILDEIITREKKSKYDKVAKQLKEKLTKNVNLKIGVLLPFMKAASSNSVKYISEEILDGITFALGEHQKQKNTFNIVSLEVRDTKKDLGVAEKELRQLASTNDVIAIIGPLFSNIAKACATIAEKARIPLITPTATANGIASIGPHIFQANPDYETRGKVIARYAVNNLGYTQLAVLACMEPIGKALAESFVKEALRLGAKIVINESYPKGASDLSDQFYNLRKAGFSVNHKTDDSHKLEVPLTGIQGLFIAIADPEEIDIIASQVKYFNIETQLLGSSEWYDPSQIEASKRNLNRMIFIVDSYLDERDTIYIEFAKNYFAQMKKNPTKYVMIGYDIMKMLLVQIDHGAVTSEKLTLALSILKNYQGIHSKITFRHGRVNSEMYVLKLMNGEIQKVTEISIH